MNRLAEYLIQTADGPAYRSGNLDGMRHPAVDGRMIRAAEGMRKLLEEADELEQAGLICTERKSGGGYRTYPFSGQCDTGALYTCRSGRPQSETAEMDPGCREVGG